MAPRTDHGRNDDIEYRFTLRYRLAKDDRDHDDLVERLGAAGCDDALVGVGSAGHVALEFSRGSGDAITAIATALAAVKRAIPGAELIEASPDLVGLSDVAEVLGMSRQNVRKLMLAHGSSFPVPVHAGSAGVWHLADVLTWFHARGTVAISRATLDVANAAMQVNLIKAATRASPRMQRDLRALI